MLERRRADEKVRSDFFLPTIDSKRLTAVIELLSAIPSQDYERLLNLQDRFAYFIPEPGLGSSVLLERKNLLYLSPELEKASPDIVRAHSAAGIAHILLGHDSHQATQMSPTKEIAAYEQAIKWGYEIELKKLKAAMYRRKTSQSKLQADLIAAAFGAPNEYMDMLEIEEEVVELVERKPLALIIEDDKDSARLYSRILLPMGYDYQIVPDQETALARLDVIEPQMVILDMSLTKWKRDQAGVVILNKIRHDDRLRNTSVVVVTAYSVLADEVVNQVEGILIKPISALKLQSLVEAAG